MASAIRADCTPASSTVMGPRASWDSLKTPMEASGSTKSSRYETKYVHDVTSMNWPAKRRPDAPLALVPEPQELRSACVRAKWARSVQSPTRAPAPLQAPKSQASVVSPSSLSTTYAIRKSTSQARSSRMA